MVSVINGGSSILSTQIDGHWEFGMFYFLFFFVQQVLRFKLFVFLREETISLLYSRICPLRLCIPTPAIYFVRYYSKKNQRRSLGTKHRRPKRVM